MAVFFISIALPGPTLYNADTLYALVITSGFNLHHIEVENHDPASGSLEADQDPAKTSNKLQKLHFPTKQSSKTLLNVVTIDQ